jgi:hypothetical protein
LAGCCWLPADGRLNLPHSRSSRPLVGLPATRRRAFGVAAPCSQAKSQGKQELLDALEQRKDIFEIKVETGQLDMTQYLAEVRAATAKAKAESQRRKAAGDTQGALHMMRRAKIMTDEVKKAEDA